MMEAKHAAPFHAHLDACAQCREHPFDLCREGAAILTGTFAPEPVAGSVAPSLAAPELLDLVRAVVREAAQAAIEKVADQAAAEHGRAAREWMYKNRDLWVIEIAMDAFTDPEGGGPVDRLLEAVALRQSVNQEATDA